MSQYQYQYQPQTQPQPSSDFNSTLQSVKEAMTQLSQSQSDAQKEASDLRDKLTHQYIVNETLRDQYNKAQNERDEKQQQIDALQDKVTTYERHIDTLQTNIDAANTSRQKVEQELAQQKAQCASLEDEMKKKLATETNAMNAVKGQLQSERQHVSDLSKSIDGYTAQIAKDQQTINQLRTEINQTKEKITTVQAQYAQLRDARDQDKRDIAAKYEQQVNDALNEAQAERQKASKTAADANKALEDFSNRVIDRMKKQKSQYDADMAAQRKHNDELSSLLDDVTKDRDSLRTQIATLSRSSSSNRNKASELNASLEATQSELARANSKIEDYEKRISEFDDRIAAERHATDIARENAQRQTSVAARKYADAIKMRDEFEGIINGLSASIEGGKDIDASELRDRVKAFLDVVNGSKKDDDAELLKAIDADADDVKDVNGVYKTDGEIDKDAKEIEDAVANDADDTDGTDEYDDDDFSFPTGGFGDFDASSDDFDGFATDDDLEGTPLSNTGDIDGDLLMNVVGEDAAE